jgi:GntR family transcriptional regulator/MocR family aminotransferase
VIVEVYEQLAAEGYLEGRQGSGNYVAPGAFLERADKFSLTGSSRAESQPARDGELIDFRSGIPALDLFPRKTWAKIMQHVCSEVHSSALSYGEPEGREELREGLSRYLFRSRGVECRPDQILITSGATQALALIARVLVSEGDEVFLEDPVTRDIQTIFAAVGATLCPIPVDELGMQTELLPSDNHSRFVFVTPSHQFPLGGTLPIQRRIQLIQFARKSHCYIVEDDYDSEFRHGGPPVSSLQGLFPERVIYVGSFSQTLSPALRLGYLVLPDALVERYRTAK